MVRAIFFDIDGTLVSFRTHTICESTKRALLQLRERGIKLFIATGRSIAEIGFLRECFDFEFDGYVLMNGQYCYCKDDVIHENYISKNSMEHIVNYLENHHLCCHFVERDYAYMNRRSDEMLGILKEMGGIVDDVSVEDSKRALTHDTFQMSVFVHEDEEESLLKQLPGCKSARWHPLFTDIIPADGGKPEGVRKMLEYFEISLEESLAFGDGGNDIDMLKTVSIGIAMGNANDAVKEAADYVTKDVDEDGIVTALNHFHVLD